MTDAIRLVVVDDHAVVRSGLRAFLELQDDIAVVAEAASGEEALAVVRSTAPDVVLMDLALPGMDGVEAVRRLRAADPDVRILALTSFSTDERIFAALRAGVAGYLLKDVTPHELADAIRAVHRGGAPLHPAVAARVLEGVGGPPREEPPLTAREREVLALIATGLPNKSIARRLGVSEKTVKAHVSHVFAKLGVSDRTQAALLAVRTGLADPP